MRGLMVLCFAALATAAPEGYNYPSGGDGVQYQQQSLISKRFFLHSAPEEQEIEVQHRDIAIGTPRKNYNVVFVKSPSAKQQKTKVRIIPAVQEDKTVVYVLAKKASEAEVEAFVEETVTTTSKPEVFFIKYKTNAEAQHAQHSIQAEYDSLGGSSSISDEGISPVSSVIGSLDGIQQSGSASSSYLPPVKKH